MPPADNAGTGTAFFYVGGEFVRRSLVSISLVLLLTPRSRFLSVGLVLSLSSSLSLRFELCLLVFSSFSLRACLSLSMTCLLQKATSMAQR